jgi:hypothetical protein
LGQVARVKGLASDLDLYLERLRPFNGKDWNCLSPAEQGNVAGLQHEVDGLVLRLARRGIKHPYVTRRLATLRALGDKDFLRRAHLEAGVHRPIAPGDLELWYRIERRLELGESRESIRKALIADRAWKGSRQAFDKLLACLGLLRTRVQVRVTVHTPRLIRVDDKVVLRVARGRPEPR